MFEDPEARRNKKINKVARNGAYAVGGGVGLLFMNALYPYDPSAEKIASLFGYVSLLLIGYGALTLACVMFRRNLAIPLNIFMVWLVLPAALVMIFSKFWAGS